MYGDFEVPVYIFTFEQIWLWSRMINCKGKIQLVSFPDMNQTVWSFRLCNKLLDFSTTQPSHFIKTTDINSFICFQHSCESRWGQPTQQACTLLCTDFNRAFLYLVAHQLILVLWFSLSVSKGSKQALIHWCKYHWWDWCSALEPRSFQGFVKDGNYCPSIIISTDCFS